MFANKRNFFVFFCTYFAFCDCAFVDTLQKCQPEDLDCIKKVIKDAIVGIASTGVPEYDIPPIDPMNLKNIKVNAFDVTELTITEGNLRGIKDCEIVDVKLHMEKGNAKLKLLCDLTAKGKYELSGSAPALKDLLGAESFKGKGNFKVKVEKLLITCGVKFNVVKRDEKVFIEIKKDSVKYDFDLQGGSHLTLDNFFIGNTDSSKIIMDYYNQNYKSLWKDYGKKLLSPAIDIAYGLMNKLFQTVESKYYINEDLDKYIKN